MYIQTFAKYMNGLQIKYENYSNSDPTSTNGVAINVTPFKCKDGYIL